MAATSEPQRLSVPVSDRDHTRGEGSAPVTVLMYGDYECPYSAKAHRVIAELLTERAGDVRFAYRHFPLAKIHPHAQQAAEAAEAAAAQGEFWALHDLLFAHQRQLELADLVRYADELGLDSGRVRREIGEHTHERRVRDDTRSGIGSGVAATPSIFINGMLRVERFRVEELHQDVDDAVRQSTAQEDRT